MKLSGLIGMPVLDAAGRKLGRLEEIRAVDGRGAELVYGAAGWLERITGRAQPTALSWTKVDKIGTKAIRLR